MTYTRRDFLHLAALTSCAAALPASAFSDSHAIIPELVARPARQQLLPEGYPQTRIWGYDGTIPAPEIRLTQGDRLRRTFRNEIPQPSSIHWHGIRIDNAMDGVSGLTQDAVPTGGTFEYDFVVPDAGTYWYHAHNRSMEQVARGLRGALIVEEKEPPDIDREEVLVLDDWLIDPDSGQLDGGFDRPMTLSHGGRAGNYITTNGRYQLSVPVKRNERLRLRVINASNARIYPLRLSGLKGWTVALDGMPLEQATPLPEELILAPAQRMDLIVDITADEGETARLSRIGNDEQSVPQVDFRVQGTASNARRNPPLALPPNPAIDVPDLTKARPVKLVMSGGAMGRMRSALLNGERRDSRALAARGRFWALNDVAERTDTPLADLSLHEPVRLEIVNQTVFPHAMHLHGMHFREVGPDGALGPMRDTTLLAGNETREIAFIADNPGDWLFHCHMLAHAASGMTTWMRVT